MYTGSPARLTNYQNGGFDPAKPDEHVQTLTRYDGAGNVTWQRDALGRWTSMEYDALGATASRTVGGQTTSYGYTGDGVLAKATTPTTTTNYLQDFAAPLAQVLNDGTATALYGHERLAAQTPSATTWYAYDGLGSLRQTLDGSGVALASANYDPWGTPQGSAVAPFGFTGELQDGAGQVYLRARWSTPGSGTFTAYRSRRDEAWDTIPSSYHP